MAFTGTMRERVAKAATFHARTGVLPRSREHHVRIAEATVEKIMGALWGPTPEMLAAGAAAIGTTEKKMARIWRVLCVAMSAKQRPPSAIDFDYAAQQRQKRHDQRVAKDRQRLAELKAKLAAEPSPATGSET